MSRAPRSLGRREALLAVALVAAAGCRPKSDERCGFCGMKIVPGSSWTAEVVAVDGAVHRFDTPKCALLAWRKGSVRAQTIRFQEFYERAWREAASLRFALGSDVIGPMGADAVPVAPERAAKFADDHGPQRTVGIDDLTVPVLEAL